MERLGRFFGGVKDYFSYNGATLSGSIDVIVIRHPDGSLHSSPFSVRFGKFKVFKPKNKPVSVTVNGRLIEGIEAHLASNGKVYLESMSPGPLTRSITESELEIMEGTLRANEVAPDRRSRQMTFLANADGDVAEAEDFALKLQFSLCRGAVIDRGEEPMTAFHNGRVGSRELRENYAKLVSTEDMMVMLNGKIYPWEEVQQTMEEVLLGRPDSVALTISPDSPERMFTLEDPELRLLGLIPGPNSIEFSVHSKRRKRVVSAWIYLWDSTTRIVVSDIDGTITRSNLLGHVLPKVNRDWSQKDICQLFTKVHGRGYEVLYLTSRAIGQSDSTRNYLSTLRQERCGLPPGPVITSPYRLFASIVREVITHKSEIFKYNMLKCIASLYPPDSNPFNAGFGNTEADSAAYSSAGVPKDRIFIVDYDGTVHVDGVETTFIQMSQLIASFFPVNEEGRALRPSEGPEIYSWPS